MATDVSEAVGFTDEKSKALKIAAAALWMFVDIFLDAYVGNIEIYFVEIFRQTCTEPTTIIKAHFED